MSVLEKQLHSLVLKERCEALISSPVTHYSSNAEDAFLNYLVAWGELRWQRGGDGCKRQHWGRLE